MVVLGHPVPKPQSTDDRDDKRKRVMSSTSSNNCINNIANTDNVADKDIANNVAISQDKHNTSVENNDVFTPQVTCTSRDNNKSQGTINEITKGTNQPVTPQGTYTTQNQNGSRDHRMRNTSIIKKTNANTVANTQPRDTYPGDNVNDTEKTNNNHVVFQD